MERRPIEIYEDAKKAESEGSLDRAIDLYTQAGYFHQAARIALATEKPLTAIDLFVEAEDPWSANNIRKKLSLPEDLINVPKFYNGGEAPVYNDSPDLVTLVSMREKAITHSQDKKPVLATCRIGSCVGVAGFDPNKKIGFLAHYDGSEDLDWSIVQLEEAMKEQKPLEFEITLVASIMQGSRKNYGLVKRAFTRERKHVRFRIVEEDYFDDFIKAIALDTRTGTKYYFDNQKYKLKMNRPARISPISLSNLIYNSLK